MSSRVQQDVDHASLEAAKWIALLTMTLDHYGKIVAPDLFVPTHAIGRLSFPLFAGILGLRLSVTPALASRYLRRLLLWGVVSQPVFVIAGRPWRDGNILFTLGLGVLAWRAGVAWRAGRPAAALLDAALAMPLAFLTEFGPFGVVVPAGVALVARYGIRAAMVAIGPLGLLANVVLEPPWLTPIDLWALGATPIMLASPRLSPPLPRLPGPFFYAYYPAHLLALHLIDLRLRAGA
jgi:hypothetical protein